MTFGYKRGGNWKEISTILKTIYNSCTQLVNGKTVCSNRKKNRFVTHHK